MGTLKIIRLGLWAAVGVIIIVMTAAAMGLLPGAQRGGILQADIGGPFVLTASNGQQVSSEDFSDKAKVIFFGFTHCPDICPTTLVDVSSWLEQMGGDADRVQAMFITVDPERDTPQVLDDYLSAFDGRILGLSGSAEQIDQVVKDYRIYAQKVPLDDGGYTMDHTATVFLYDRDGAFVGTIAYGEDDATAVEKLKRLAS